MKGASLLQSASACLASSSLAPKEAPKISSDSMVVGMKSASVDVRKVRIGPRFVAECVKIVALLTLPEDAWYVT